MNEPRRRGRRRSRVVQHRRTNPWASGIYAAALFVALLIVLLFLRSYADRAADAVLTLTAQPEDTAPRENAALQDHAAEAEGSATAPTVDDPQKDAILGARDRLFNAISTAQHAALSAIDRNPDDDARP